MNTKLAACYLIKTFTYTLSIFIAIIFPGGCGIKYPGIIPFFIICPGNNSKNRIKIQNHEDIY
jgi:hypothetical protein